MTGASSGIPSWAKIERYRFTQELTVRELMVQFMRRAILAEKIKSGSSGGWEYSIISEGKNNAFIPRQWPIFELSSSTLSTAINAVRLSLECDNLPGQELIANLRAASASASDGDAEKYLGRIVNQWALVKGAATAGGIDKKRIAALANPAVLMALDVLVCQGLSLESPSEAVIARRILGKPEVGGGTMKLVKELRDAERLRKMVVTIGKKGFLDLPVKDLIG